jgi:hypothetical protein
MQRRILAGLTIVTLSAAATIWWWWPEAEGSMTFCTRMGAILGAAWLAYDDVQRLPNWLLLAMPVLLIVLVRFSRLLLLLIPLLIVWAILNRLLGLGMGRNR